MSTRDWQLRIEDILEAIRRIEQYTEGMQYEQWQNDQKTADAVIRNIEIIGEAAKHVPLEVQKNFPAVPWGKMRGDKEHSDPRVLRRRCRDPLANDPGRFASPGADAAGCDEKKSLNELKTSPPK